MTQDSLKTQESLKEHDWTTLFDRLIKYSPTAQALSKVRQEHSLSQALKMSLSKALEEYSGLKEERKEEKALYYSFEKASYSPQLETALQGDRISQELLISQVITNYLKMNPWGQLSEAEVAQLWLKWSAILSEGVSIQEEELWVTIPSVKLKYWVELGLKESLEQVFSCYTSLLDSFTQQKLLDSSQATVALSIKGKGKSASLAYIRRFLLAENLPCSFYSQFTELGVFHTSEEIEPILLIDDLSYQGRLARWRVAECLSQSPLKPILMIWTADEQRVSEKTQTKQSLSAQIKAQFKHIFEIDLDQLWQKQSITLAERFNHLPDWLCQTQAELLDHDYLRCLMSIKKPPNSEPSDQMSDLDAFAALLGPLAPIKVLVLATKQHEDSLSALLKASGWVEVGDCPIGGALYAPPSLLFWRAAMIEGGRRAHQCAYTLVESIEQTYNPHQRLFLFHALQRLSRLRGRGDYLGQTEPYSDLKQALVSLRRIQKTLTHKTPHAFALSTLCGLGFDWAARGPQEGYWNETLHALQIAAAAAERLREPQLAGRFLHLLGSIALKDGRAEMAESSLETALHLLKATRLAKEASDSALLLAEAKLLDSELTVALAALKNAEKVAKSLLVPQVAWRARFRAGQLYAMSGQMKQAMRLWQSLNPSLSSEDHKSEQESNDSKMHEKSAVGTLNLELASLILKADKHDWGHDSAQDYSVLPYLKQLEDSSLSRSILHSIHELYAMLTQTNLADALSLQNHLEQLAIPLSQALIQSQQNRDIGSWLAWQYWRSEVNIRLEELTQSSELELQSIPDLFSAKETRLGLELSLKVVVGARDRLNIMMIYQQLSAVYYYQSEREASLASWSMAKGWATSLGLTFEKLKNERWSMIIEQLHHQLDQDLIDSTLSEAKQEIEQLRSRWKITPLSSVLTENIH